MVPLRTSKPASWPVKSAMKASREVVVGSSPKTSSRRVVRWMADNMEEVGVVTTSPVEECQRRRNGWLAEEAVESPCHDIFRGGVQSEWKGPTNS